MFIPVDEDSSGIDQAVWRVEKDEHGHVTKTKLFGVRYVPLTDAPKA
jgi:protein-L-isoaspartate(D-aspartate) O-methyltransferase